MSRTIRIVHFALALALLTAVRDAWAAKTNFVEGFETALVGWIVGDSNPEDTPAYWARVDSAFGGEGTHAGNFKGYCAGTGFDGTATSPLYRDNMRAYLSRTVDLSGYTNATLTFWYRIPALEKDYDFARVFLNGSEIWSTDQPQTTWRLARLSLEPFIGQTNILSFEFSSDRSISFEGWYLDDIALTDDFTPAPPPANDNFSAAQSLPGSIGSVAGTTRGASAESAEIDPGNSIWFRWSPYTNGLVTFRTGGSAIDTLLCVYTGNSLSALTRLACDDNGDTNGASLVSFSASVGTDYRLSIRGANGAAGFVLLSWDQPGGLGPPLLPDLSIWTDQQNDYLYGWYLDQQEPTQPGRTLLRASTATPNTGHGPLELRGSSTTPGVYQRIFRADGSWFDRFAGNFTFHPGHGHLHFDNWLNLHLRSVLTNNGVGDIVAAGDKTSFAIIDLRTYNSSLPGYPATSQYSGGLIQGLSVGWGDVYGAGLADQWIDVTDVPSGRYWLEAIVDPANSILEENESNNAARILINFTALPPVTNTPPNDNFSRASQIPAITGGAIGHNTNATFEAGEPRNPADDGGRSVWWRWTAPTNMTAVISTDGSGVDTILAVYTGTNLSGLTLVAYDDDSGAGSASRVSFTAIAQTTYSIAVDGYGGAVGSIQLHVNPAWNDAFANCLPLSDLLGSASGSNRGATRQSGEPSHAGVAGSSSVWYCWTAPLTGPATFDTIGSTFDTLLAVYTGTAVGSLVPVASDNDSGGNGASRVSFNTVGGTTYRIAVDGPAGASGVIQLHWLGPSPPRILGQPASTNLVAGAPAVFSVSAIGTAPLQFQWQHADVELTNSVYVQGALNPTLRVTKSLPQDAGIYLVVITNIYGAVTSAPANLIVLDNPRVVYFTEAQAPIGGVAALPIMLQAVGDENTFRFTVQFDPTVLSKPRVLQGADVSDSTLAVSTNLVLNGRLGITLSLPPTRNVVPGPERELARVLFDVSDAPPDGSTTDLGFTDGPVARFVGTTNNVSLTTLFVAGQVQLHTVNSLISGERLADGLYRLTLQGLGGRTYAIEASSDLEHWEALTTIEAGLDGSLQFADPDSSSLPQRFYRMRIVP